MRRSRHADGADDSEREAVLAGLREVERRFAEERDRHEEEIQTIRAEMHALLARGIAAGVGATSMSRALGVSRGRLNRIIERDLPDE